MLSREVGMQAYVYFTTTDAAMVIPGREKVMIRCRFTSQSACQNSSPFIRCIH